MVGAGAQVLGGFTVGDGARIGSNAVVKPVPAGATAVGNPARIIGQDATPGTEGSDVHAAAENQRAGAIAGGIPLIKADWIPRRSRRCYRAVGRPQ